MYGSSFKYRRFVAKKIVKLNNTINTCLIRLNIILYYSLPLNIYDERLISKFINTIVIDRKIIHISFKDTSLDSVALNPLKILPRQNWVGKLTFLLSALNLKIYFLLTNK